MDKLLAGDLASSLHGHQITLVIGKCRRMLSSPIWIICPQQVSIICTTCTTAHYYFCEQDFLPAIKIIYLNKINLNTMLLKHLCSLSLSPIVMIVLDTLGGGPGRFVLFLKGYR